MNKEKMFSFKDVAIIVLIAFLTILFFSKVIFSENYKITWDAFDQQYPWINSTAGTISSGKFPLWSENFFSGFPTFEDPQVGTFYPVNILLAVFCSENGFLSYKCIEISIILHYMLMGVFTYILCKNLKLSKMSAVFAAILFEFCGYMACHPQHYSSIMSLTYLPLSLNFLINLYKRNSKKSIFGFIISFALCILGGHIQTALYSGMFLLLITVILSCKKGKESKKIGVKFFVKICILFISAGLIASIQLIPTLELMKNSTRSDMTYEEFSKNSNEPINFITAIMPYFLDIDNSWFSKEPTETHLYLSITLLTMILLFMTRDKKQKKNDEFLAIWIISGIIFFIFSLGESTFVSRLLYLIPFVNKLRRSVNYFYIVSLLIGIIGAYAFDYVLKNRESLNYDKYKKCIKVLDIVFLVLIAIAYIALFNAPDLKKLEIIRKIINGLWISTVFLNIVWYFTYLYVSEKISSSIFSVVILTMLVIDLFTFNSNIKPNASHQNYNVDLTYDCIQGDTYVNEILRKANTENARVVVCGVDVLNASGVIKVSDIWGYNPIKLESYNEYAKNFGLDLGDKPTEKTDFSSNYIDMLSVKYILTTNDFIRKNETLKEDKYIQIYNKNNIVILENKEYKESFYVTNSVRKAKSNSDIYDIIGKEGYDPKTVVYSSSAIEKDYGSDAKIVVKSQNPSKITLEVESEKDVYLVTSKIMYDGWKIKINGKSKEPDVVNGIFIASEVEAGKNIVEIYYLPKVLFVGIASSIVGIVILIVCLVKCKKENKGA